LSRKIDTADPISHFDDLTNELADLQIAQSPKDAKLRHLEKTSTQFQKDLSNQSLKFHATSLIPDYSSPWNKMDNPDYEK